MGLDNIRSIDESLSKLEPLKLMLSRNSTKDLQLMKSDISALVEDYKQVSLFTSMIATIIAGFTFLIGIVKDIFRVLTTENLVYNSISMLILILYTGFLIIGVLRLFAYFSKRSLKLISFQKIFDLVLQERELIDQQHIEAYAEYQQFLQKTKKYFQT